MKNIGLTQSYIRISNRISDVIGVDDLPEMRIARKAQD